MAWERAEGAGQRHCASTPRLRRLTVLGNNDLQDGGCRALAEALRLNTTLASMNHSYNDLGEGGAQALGETLRLNSTVTWLDLRGNGLGKEVRSVLRQDWGEGEGNGHLHTHC